VGAGRPSHQGPPITETWDLLLTRLRSSDRGKDINSEVVGFTDHKVTVVVVTSQRSLYPSSLKSTFYTAFVPLSFAKPSGETTK